MALAAHHSPVRRANELAVAIGRRRPEAAVCLFGSLARGRSAAQGDIDLLVVEAEERTRPTTLLHGLPVRPDDEPPLNLVTYSLSDLQRLWDSGSPIAFHIAREARVLRDPLGLMKTVLEREPERNAAQAASREISRLRPYRDLARFNGDLTSCFAQIYSVGRTLVMLRLGDLGQWEFDRRRCFSELAAVEPERSADVRRIASLEPFEAWRRRRPGATPPFSADTRANPSAADEFAESIAAVDRLADSLAV
jgi:predicted nucleotidyltransferase